jgi:hypothetical protein
MDFYLVVTSCVALISATFFIVWCLLYNGEDWGRTWIKTAGLVFLTCWAWPLWVVFVFYLAGKKFVRVLKDDREA